MPTYTNTRTTLGDQEALDALIAHTLTEFVDDDVLTLGQYALYKQTALQNVYFPRLTSVGSNAFTDCTAQQTVRIGGKCTISSAFSGCSALQGVIQENAQACTLNNYDAFANTPIAKGQAGIYVTDDLVSTYKAANNWKTYAHLIFPVSSYPRNSMATITDTWVQIIAAGEDGTYDSKYNVGDTAQISLNGTNYMIMLVAKDADELTGGGTAHMTWLLMNQYGTHKMSANMTDGWEASGTDTMRYWLNDTVFSQLPSELQASGVIKAVNKTYWDATANSNAGEQKTSSDRLWIPSSREVCFTGNYLKETSGVQYSGVFSDNPSRVRFASTGSTSYWWTRSANSTSNFVIVNYNGYYNNSGPTNTGGVVFGFCI